MSIPGSDADDFATLRRSGPLLALGPGSQEVPGGEVWLVGAGPGDPELLTLKALRLIRQADVILYDRLVSQEILALCRAEARRIFVGKARERHALPQQRINALLVALARGGKKVCRLKGGDPFIFGRGGEELQALAEAGIPYQVVPGVTAAAGCAAYAGIPLTHRDYAQSVTFLTAERRQGAEDPTDWGRLAAPGQTLVFYMGLAALPRIAAELLAQGLPPGTPAAVIQDGTRPSQRVVTATLESIATRAAEAGLGSPALVIVGQTVALRELLAWQPTAPDGAAADQRSAG